ERFVQAIADRRMTNAGSISSEIQQPKLSTDVAGASASRFLRDISVSKCAPGRRALLNFSQTAHRLRYSESFQGRNTSETGEFGRNFSKVFPILVIGGR